MARVLVSMPDKFLENIDNLAEGEQRTRSELIREALRRYINEQKERLPRNIVNREIDFG